MTMNLLLLTVTITSNLFYVVRGQCGSIDIPTTLTVNISGGVGTLKSLNYPNDYPNFAYCQWLLRSSTPFVQINITDFCTEKEFDYLRIYDGDSFDSPILATISGCDSFTFTQVSPIFTSSQSNMFLRFVSDGTMTMSGFNATYSSVRAPPLWPCFIGTDNNIGRPPLVVSGSRGMIQSPFFPSNYISNVFCELVLSTESGNVFQVSVSNFCTENSFDILRFFDGNNVLSPPLPMLTGCPVNDVRINSTQQYLFIRFVSDQSNVNRGFTISYNAIPGGSPACVSQFRPMQLNAASGFIASPNYPGSYFNNANCSWVLTAPIGQVIRITIIDYCLEQPFDTVTINDGPSDRSSTLVGLSGCQVRQTNNSQYTTSQRYMNIRFVSDATIPSRGFNMTYSFVPATLSRACSPLTFPDRLSERTGSFSSPYYPNYYPNNLDCQWVINATYSRERISLTITYMNIEPNYDFIRVYDGDSLNGEMLANLSGFNSTVQPAIPSRTRSMLVRFVTDFSIVYTGFNAQYITIEGLRPTV